MAQASLKGKTGLLDDLKARGLVHDHTDPNLGKLLEAEKIAVYCGFDPTAESLQLGNLVPLLALARFQRAGHTPIVVLGGGTGMIGDPSGKSDERNLLDQATIARNIESQRPQIARFLEFKSGDNRAIMVNNLEWLKGLNLIDFLRDVGKAFPLSVMLGRESVKRRVGSDSGMSFTEFSYQILQAYDFYHLYTNYNCRMQIGGSDQYGNILAGVEYIRRMTGREHRASALILPLITDSAGQKLGKTAKGTVWLAAEKTSPYEWYQHWLNVDDRDAIRYLKFFTFLSLDEIEAIGEEFAQKPKDRLAQRILAEQVTALVHGEGETEKAKAASAALFGTGAIDLTRAGGPPLEVVPAEPGDLIADVLYQAKLVESKAEAKRLLRQGAVTIGAAKLVATKTRLEASDWPAGEDVIVLAAGPRRRVALKRKPAPSSPLPPGRGLG